MATYVVHGYPLEAVDHWQTLITGVLALVAAAFTIWATVASANREVAASQRQVDETRRMERRQLAREGYAFMAMVDAAMSVMLEEIETAGRMCQRDPPRAHSTQAYLARHLITRTGFPDILSAMVRQGGILTEPLLRLDRTAATFTVTIIPVAGEGYVARHVGIHEELQQLEFMANSLRSDATARMQACLDVLEATEVLRDGRGGAGS